MPQDLAKESPEVATPRIIAVAAGTLLFLLAVAFGFRLLFKERIGQTYAVQRAFPLPGVVPDEAKLRLALEAKQRAALEGGSRRMPINQAMDEIVARGPRAFDPLEGQP